MSPPDEQPYYIVSQYFLSNLYAWRSALNRGDVKEITRTYDNLTQYVGALEAIARVEPDLHITLPDQDVTSSAVADADSARRSPPNPHHRG